MMVKIVEPDTQRNHPSTSPYTSLDFHGTGFR
jgi:hypothetical protein